MGDKQRWAAVAEAAKESSQNLERALAVVERMDEAVADFVAAIAKRHEERHGDRRDWDALESTENED